MISKLTAPSLSAPLLGRASFKFPLKSFISTCKYPQVPNYGKRGTGTKLSEGIVIAIEPMITFGKKDIIQERDGWTIKTKDRKPAAHFEHDVAVRNGKAEILSSFEWIEGNQ